MHAICVNSKVPKSKTLIAKSETLIWEYKTLIWEHETLIWILGPKIPLKTTNVPKPDHTQSLFAVELCSVLFQRYLDLCLLASAHSITLCAA